MGCDPSRPSRSPGQWRQAAAAEQRIAVVTPVFNDWTCLDELVSAIAELPGDLGSFSVLAVDDGSTVAPPELHTLTVPDRIGRFEVIRLACNLGHQRAIAVGLCKVAKWGAFDAVIVMDCDGEDRPAEFASLLDAHAAQPEAVIVAQRWKRSESLGFRVLYTAYRFLFRILTGHVLDFGNYSLIPSRHIHRLTCSGDLWNHLAATLLRSRLPLVRVPTIRGKRYDGRSSMSVYALLLHGLSAISVFMDSVLIRLLVLSAALAGLSIFLAAGLFAFQLPGDAAVPMSAAWATGIAALMFTQAVAFLFTVLLAMLANRSRPSIIPARDVLHLVREEGTDPSGSNSDHGAHSLGNAGPPP